MTESLVLSTCWQVKSYPIVHVSGIKFEITVGRLFSTAIPYIPCRSELSQPVILSMVNQPVMAFDEDALYF